MWLNLLYINLPMAISFAYKLRRKKERWRWSEAGYHVGWKWECLNSVINLLLRLLRKVLNWYHMLTTSCITVIEMSTFFSAIKKNSKSRKLMIINGRTKEEKNRSKNLHTTLSIALSFFCQSPSPPPPPSLTTHFAG